MTKVPSLATWVGIWVIMAETAEAKPVAQVVTGEMAQAAKAAL